MSPVHRYSGGTSVSKGQAEVSGVFKQYNPWGQQMLQETAGRLVASVLGIHNNVRALRGLQPLPLVTMGGFARNIVAKQGIHQHTHSKYTRQHIHTFTLHI